MTAPSCQSQQRAETLRHDSDDVTRLADWLLHMQGTFEFLMQDSIVKDHVAFLKRSEEWLRASGGDVRAAVIEESDFGQFINLIEIRNVRLKVETQTGKKWEVLSLPDSLAKKVAVVLRAALSKGAA